MAYSKTDFTQGSGTEYKTKIDDNFAALEQASKIDTVEVSDPIELGGDFNAGEEMRFVRIGMMVTAMGIGGSLQHSLDSQVSSLEGVVPAAFRPSGSASVIYNFSSVSANRLQIVSSGTVFINYYDPSDGSATNRSATGSAPVISYLVDT